MSFNLGSEREITMLELAQQITRLVHQETGHCRSWCLNKATLVIQNDVLQILTLLEKRWHGMLKSALNKDCFNRYVQCCNAMQLA